MDLLTLAVEAICNYTALLLKRSKYCLVPSTLDIEFHKYEAPPPPDDSQYLFVEVSWPVTICLR